MNKDQQEFLQTISYIYLLHGKYEKALIFLLALKRLFPNDPHTLLSRSYAYLKLKAFQACIEEAEACKKLSNEPRYNYANLMIARGYFGLGNVDKAKDSMQLFIKNQAI